MRAAYRLRRSLLLACALALALVPAWAAASARVETLLRQADASRSADPDGFRVLLAEGPEAAAGAAVDTSGDGDGVAGGNA